ncbi:hypothetical protein IC229_11465 [Spirosoma sp. BT702]|uniref:Uncharacterized protein n=1 Tax=Spirosoma profusum TaxID=2771354 RepID=A0A926XVB9_9BACT|nr:hypothetical protein [Spirosoma profusum]MBD2701258.1 hypothetical protein [Spirosoma profusum]
MKNAILYVLLIATLLPTVSQWGTIAYYHANRDYIARVLCQNRNRPDLHCNGQCYLAKRLKAQQEKQDKETTQRVQNSPVVQLFCTDFLGFTFTATSITDREKTTFSYLLKPYLVLRSAVFQPPITHS